MVKMGWEVPPQSSLRLRQLLATMRQELNDSEHVDYVFLFSRLIGFVRIDFTPLIVCSEEGNRALLLLLTQVLFCVQPTATSLFYEQCKNPKMDEDLSRAVFSSKMFLHVRVT